MAKAKKSQASVAKISDDLWTIVGGSFTQDSLSPVRYHEMVQRVKARPTEYLEVFRSLFVETKFDETLHSDLFPEVFLALVSEVQPETTRQVADVLAKRYRGVPRRRGASHEDALRATRLEGHAQYLEMLARPSISP